MEKGRPHLITFPSCIGYLRITEGRTINPGGGGEQEEEVKQKEKEGKRRITKLHYIVIW